MIRHKHNAELRVVQQIPRGRGGVTYVLNAVSAGGQGRATVYHSITGSFVCGNPSCGGWDKPTHPGSRPCDHTDVAREYFEEHGDPAGDAAPVRPTQS